MVADGAYGIEVAAGRWHARLVPAGAAAAGFALRARVFRDGACDRDGHDATARHLLIDGPGGLAACARVTVQAGEAILSGYGAEHYDLRPFAATFPRALEVGRLCLDPACRDPEVPRLILAMLARLATDEGVDVLHGCSSFPADGTGMVALAKHTAPPDWAPRPKAASRVPLPATPGRLPPMVRSYLSLGARVSDHAVVDRDLGTLHVFTALPIATIPPARARLLTGLLEGV